MKLAIGEMRRAKLRFALLTAAIALLVFLILFQRAIAGSLLEEFTGGLERQSSAVLVYGADARRTVDGSYVTPDQVEAVGDVPGVAAYGPIGEASFTVDVGGGDLRDTSIFGYELGGPGFPTTVSDGRLPEREGEAVASAADAGDGFAIGRTVTVGGVRVRIVGLADDIRFNVQPTLFVLYATYEDLVRAANPDADVVLPSLVGVEPSAGVDPADLAAAIGRTVPDVEALDRATAVESLPGVASIAQSFAIILGLAFVVVALLSGFFFLIITVQKATALTLLRAVGASTGYLVRNLVVQVLVVTSLASVVAVAMAAVSVRFASESVGVGLDPAVVVSTVGAVLLLALVAAVASVRRIVRLDPAAATVRTGGGGLA